MVRAERNGRLYEVFRDRKVIAVGWHQIGDLTNLRSREAILAKVREQWPELSRQSAAMAAGQIHRFRTEMKVGDTVVTYDPGRRVYLVGRITGEYEYDPTIDEEDPNIRRVEWEGEVSRDLLSVPSRNSLGAISTIFLLSKDVVDDLRRAMTSQQPSSEPPVGEEIQGEEDVFNDIQSRAVEFIKDKVSNLSWSQMQELVAGLLRAMGYKTRISPSGPDRGKDIIASPDGFGFEAPRIIVEVKHRQGTMGAQAIRSFLGGRHPQDKGLYVSTGGFSKDAHYEAERASIPIHLMNLDDLVEALIEHYDSLDVETKQLVPLKRIYWPA
jgi:Uncharacterized conserved protein